MKTIPETHQTIMPYLIVANAMSLLEFMVTVFGAKETSKHMRDEQTIMHAEVSIGNSTIMFAECTAQWASKPAGLFIYVDNADETYNKAIDNGAVSLTAVSDQPYGRSGGVTDPFGNQWWITSLP